jgi:hypothetical protein
VIPDPERASVRRGLVGGPRSPVPVREMSTIWPLETGGGLRSEPLRPIAPIQFGTEVRPLDSPDTLSQHVCPCRQAARTFVLCCLHRQPPVRARRFEVCKLQATSTASEATQGLGSSTMSEVTQAGWIRVEDGAPWWCEIAAHGYGPRAQTWLHRVAVAHLRRPFAGYPR